VNVHISRTFVVRVTAAPARVVVEDVREGRRTAVGDLMGVGPQIAAWLGLSVSDQRSGDGGSREDSVSPPT
jgi:hypothetical protein